MRQKLVGLLAVAFILSISSPMVYAMGNNSDSSDENKVSSELTTKSSAVNIGKPANSEQSEFVLVDNSRRVGEIVDRYISTTSVNY